MCYVVACMDDSYFKCDNGLCLPQSLVCNGVDDCLDGSDELTPCRKSSLFTADLYTFIDLYSKYNAYIDLLICRNFLSYAQIVHEVFLFQHLEIKTLGPGAFAISGPDSWNNIPVALRDTALSFHVFCVKLKTNYSTR